MTNRIYKTAQGKIIDMGALSLQNESIRAVGNMKANARGDKIDSGGNVTLSRTQQSTKNYAQGVITNVSDSPVVASLKSTQTPLTAAPPPVDANAVSTPTSGIAAALARAKNTKE
jgi:hypothetical protein